eukprot:653864-Rhodomonas_salina.1
MGRGLRQGDSLLPVLFLLFVNVLLHQMRLEGVGLRTKGGDVWSVAYVDDVSTPSNLEGGVQRGLDLCLIFGGWAGIKLNVAKCEAMGCDYGRKEPMGTDFLEIEGEMLCPLRPSAAFKYLGCRTTLLLSWAKENRAVLLTQTPRGVRQSAP